MIAGPFSRLIEVLRRGDVLPAAGPSNAVTVEDRVDQHGQPALTTRSTLREIVAVVPGLADELANRARTAGLLVSWVAVIAVPAWTIVDRIAVPQLSAAFLAVRLMRRQAASA